MLAAVILSGGASSRMGSPKALLPYQGRPFLEHLLEIISRPEIGVRRVVLGADAESIAKAVPLKANEMIITALVGELIAQFYKSKKPIVLPVYEGRRGHPVIFSASLYPELLRAPLETGARAVVWAHADEVEEVPTNEEGCVLNLNDPETLNRAMDRQG